MRIMISLLLLSFFYGQVFAQSEDWIRGGEVLDQIQTESSRKITSDFDNWQSFTAGRTGFLTKVKAYHYDDEEKGTLYIYEGEGTSGKILCRQPYTADGTAFLSFIIANPISVTEGEQYTLRFTRFTWFLKEENVYQGGMSSTNPNYDQIFGTYVSIGDLLDQLQLESSREITSDFDNWQSFTAGRTGLLTKVKAYHYDNEENEKNEEKGTLYIYEGEDTSGKILCRQPYTADGNAFLSFIIANPISVTEGEQYTLRFTRFRWFLKDENVYQGGRSSTNPNYDQIFGTYVSPSEFNNWGFEYGLLRWTSTGTAFDNQPSRGDNVLTQRVLKDMTTEIGGDYWRDMPYSIGHKGNAWIGTFENNPSNELNTLGQTQGDGPKGTLISQEFIVTKKYCSFLLGGTIGQSRTQRVEIQTKKSPGPYDWKTKSVVNLSANSEYMHREVIPMNHYIGQKARIRIVDESDKGHINVDDFKFFDEMPDYIEVKDAKTGLKYKLDADAPVWGFADTHAHPTSYLGFGGTNIIGDPGKPIEETYSTSLCGNEHTVWGASEYNTIFIENIDPHWYKGGYPNFTEYPRFNSKTHQQQHIDFIKRAWQGGLRLYSALAVNNMMMSTAANTHGKKDDEGVMYDELGRMKEIVASQSSWMEIAYSAKDARRIIHQGKLAVVLGVEVDNFGNFVGSSYAEDTRYVTPLDLLTEDNSDELLDNKLDEYFNYGIRQVTPLHYISGVFGGAAVFNGTTLLTQILFNKQINVESGVNENIAYNLYDDWDDQTSAATFFGAYGKVKADWVAAINVPANSDLVSMKNADGLTPIGEKLVCKMMQRGILVDSDHMGIKSKERLFEIGKENYNYPIMSSHTDASALAFTWADSASSPQQFGDFGEDGKIKKFGTVNIHNLAHEAQLQDEHYEKIKQSGGVVSPLLLPYRRTAYKGNLGSIPNDCAGSSKTWAQMYLHSLDKMGGRGVALSSDRGMVDFIGPRFGVNASFSMSEEKSNTFRIKERAAEKALQLNGVKYVEKTFNGEKTFKNYHPELYKELSGNSYWEKESLVWKAWAYNETGGTDSKKFVGQLDGVKDKDVIDRVAMQIYHMKGNNIPLRRYSTGNRDWDFNLDGLAHYGLIPDFLQDLRNIGLTPELMAPLFNSAEDYIQMWEKAERAKENYITQK